MAWYDFFSTFYDRSLERLYADARAAAVAAADLHPGDVVLDVPVGTGPSLDGIAPAVAPNGLVIAVDASAGMLDRARRRCADKSLGGVVTLHSDVHALDRRILDDAAGLPVEITRLHVFLGLTAFPRWESAFERLWALLTPGGRAVIVDVHAERLGVQGRMVNLIARAEIRRKTWEPLERLAEGFERRDLPARKEYGGTLWLATGIKPKAA